jgi:acyl carrier protein
MTLHVLSHESLRFEVLIMSTTREKVFRTVSTILNHPLDKIDEDTSPDTVPAWDSLKHMKLMLALEEELGVQFSPTQIIEMNSVGLILAVIDETGAKPR